MSTLPKLTVIIASNKGNIRLRLFSDEVPRTVANFVNLARRGFYNGLTFHRVVNDFMIQGGCPRGDGMGDPGYRFDDEFHPGLKHDRPGILSMANSGPHSNGCQFFITHVPTPWLDNKHSVFGVVESDADLAVVNQIAANDVMASVTIEGDSSALEAKMADDIEFWNNVLNALQA